MIREAAELSRLLIGPVYYGAKEEQGDGRVVMVIPGLFGGDLILSRSAPGFVASATLRSVRPSP
jgi:hypothetical protein